MWCVGEYLVCFSDAVFQCPFTLHLNLLLNQFPRQGMSRKQTELKVEEPQGYEYNYGGTSPLGEENRSLCEVSSFQGCP